MNDSPNILMISSMDYDRIWNSCDSARLEHYPRLGVCFTLMYLVANSSTRLWDLVKDACTLGIERLPGKPGDLVKVDPLLNYCSGLRQGADRERSASVNPGFSIKHALIRLLSPLGFLRDVFFVPSFVYAALRTPGKFRACIGCGPWGALIAWIITRMGKSAVFVYLDRDFEPGIQRSKFRYWYVHKLEAVLVRRADVVVSVGHRLAALRRQQGASNVVVLPNGVDQERFSGSRTAPKLGHRLMYVGALFSWSGLDIVLEALPQLIKKHPRLTLDVVGDGLPGDRARLEQTVTELGLDEVVNFHGSQPYSKLPEFLARADIGLANSQPNEYRAYACPLKVLEYMSAGLPVVVTADTEAADMVQEAGGGIVCDYSAESLAVELDAMLGNHARFEDMHHKAINYAEQRSWSNIVSQELELIEGLLNKPGKRNAIIRSEVN